MFHISPVLEEKIKGYKILIEDIEKYAPRKDNGELLEKWADVKESLFRFVSKVK